MSANRHFLIRYQSAVGPVTYGVDTLCASIAAPKPGKPDQPTRILAVWELDADLAQRPLAWLERMAETGALQPKGVNSV